MHRIVVCAILLAVPFAAAPAKAQGDCGAVPSLSVEEIKALHKKGQPVLVGTASIESSERLSNELNKRKIAHNVLNAKQHEREADIIAQAGRPGALTVGLGKETDLRATDLDLGPRSVSFRCGITGSGRKAS